MNTDRIDFLIIGAAKSATTWLQYSLQLDTAVYMPDPELHFFSREYERGIDWYISQFERPTRSWFIGEKSNSYLDEPAAAQRIAQHMPHVKLIAQIRNPIERAYSDYCMYLRRGSVTRSIENYLDPRKEDGVRFLQSGRYGHHLRRYRDLFPADQMFVGLYDELVREPEQHVAGIRRFIGLSSESPVPLAPTRAKDKTSPIVSPRLKRLLRPVDPLLKSARGARSYQMARSLVAREMKYPELTESIVKRLADYYRDDADELGVILRRDMSSWLRARSAASVH